MAYNFAAERFHTRKLCSRLCSIKAQFLYEKRSLRFNAPFWRLRAAYAVHLRFIGKLVVDFLLVVIELFRYVLPFCYNPPV